eukprot:Opistho-1_new@55744
MLLERSMALVGGNIGGEPVGGGRQGRMLEVALQQAPHTRQVRQVTRLAIAFPQARENADDLGIALRTQHRIGGVEIGRRIGDSLVMGEHRGFDVDWHVASGILQQRHQIIGRVAGQRILEVEQAQAMGGRPVDQHDIFGMIIAQHRHGGAGRLFHDRQHRVPGAGIAVCIDVNADRRAIPFGQQPGLALIDGPVIGRHIGGGQCVQVTQQVDRAGIDGQFGVRRLVQMFLDAQVAEILDQHQPLRQVARQYPRRGETVGQQMFGDGDEGARIFMGRRRVHQHGAAAAVQHAEIAAEGCVAGERDDGGPIPSRVGEEGGRGGGGDHICDHRSVQASGTSAVKRRALSSVKSMLRRRAWPQSPSPSRSGHSMMSRLSIR